MNFKVWSAGISIVIAAGFLPESIFAGSCADSSGIILRAFEPELPADTAQTQVIDSLRNPDPADESSISGGVVKVSVSAKENSKFRSITSGLLHLVVVEPKDTTRKEPDKKEGNYHPEHVGLKVKNIEIYAVDLIEGDVNDLSVEVASALARSLNKIHSNTRKTIIRRNLTFSEGDVLSAHTIADNEYFLRSLNYIEDSRIYVFPDSLHPELADIMVVVKDLFPVTVDLGVGGLTDYTLGIHNINILGQGHKFSNSINYNASKIPSFGYRGELAFRNIRGTFIDVSLQYRNNYREERALLNVKRDFITPDTKYGGELEFIKQNSYLNVKLNDSTNLAVPYTKNYSDQWIGRVIKLNTTDRRSLMLKAR